MRRAITLRPFRDAPAIACVLFVDSRGLQPLFVPMTIPDSGEPNVVDTTTVDIPLTPP